MHLSSSFSHKQIKLYVRLLFCFYFLLLLLLAAVSTRVRGPSSPELCFFFFFHNVHALIINVPETARPPPAYQHPTCYRYAFFKCFFFYLPTLYMFVYRNFNPNVAEKMCRFILRKKSENYSTLQK